MTPMTETVFQRDERVIDEQRSTAFAALSRLERITETEPQFKSFERVGGYNCYNESPVFGIELQWGHARIQYIISLAAIGPGSFEGILSHAAGRMIRAVHEKRVENDAAYRAACYGVGDLLGFKGRMRGAS